LFIETQRRKDRKGERRDNHGEHEGSFNGSGGRLQPNRYIKPFAIFASLRFS